MRILIKNQTTNTYPCVLHFAGQVIARQNCSLKNASKTCKVVELLLKLQKKQNLSYLDKQLTIVTTHNYKLTSLVEKTLSSLGFNNVINVGKHVQQWLNFLKPKLVLSSLSSVTTEFVMFLDARDVCVIHLDNIIEKFKQTQCKMLFGAECYNYPLTKESKDFLWHENLAKKFHKYKCGPAFLNSGQWIARTNDAKFFLMDTVKVKPLQENPHSDQGVFKVTFKKYYPDINLDFGAEIFQVANALTSGFIVVQR